MTEQSQPFHDMAARIEKIEPAEFAGAVVIMPPGGGEPIVFLTTDPMPVQPQFWSSVQARVELAAAKAQQAETAMQPWAPHR
jgi:hypothetical protein